jgi:chaperone modulatory protein CbpM
MQTEDLIPAGEFCTYHHIELSFVNTLHDSGLIGTTIRDGKLFLSAGELPYLEKFVRWHYDLSINPEGIEAIAHLLERLDGLLEENRALRNKIQRYDYGQRGDLTIEGQVI